jgi:hypothetical protein
MLQGIHYPLPEDIFSKHLFEKMYETERVDKKNYQLLFMLTNLVEIVERHAQIRSGNAFAVNYFSVDDTFLFVLRFLHSRVVGQGQLQRNRRVQGSHLNTTHGRVGARKGSSAEENPSTTLGETVDNPLQGL